MSETLKICYFGTYEKDYSRNIIFIQALRDINVEVIEINEEVKEKNAKSYGSLKGLIRLFFRFFYAYFKLLFKLVFLKDIRNIFIGYPSHLDVIFFYPILKIKRQKIFFNPLVSLYDTFILDRKLFSKSSPAAKIIFFIDWLAFRLSDIIFIDTETHKIYLSQLFSIDKNKFEVIPVGAVDEFYKNIFVEKKPVFTVLYVGKYIPLHSVETIIEAADFLKDSDILFKMVGTGQDYQKALKIVNDKNIGNIEFIEWLDRESLLFEIKASHVVLGIFKKEGKALRVVPNKVYDAIAAESVVVTERSPAILEFFKEGEEIFLVEPENPKDLAEKILWIKDNYDTAKNMAVKGKKRFLHVASKKAIGEKIKKTLIERNYG